uniref:AH domain-containing protein n=1 Tax=Parascaris equorum TaxID=6256 RepID=A0A914RI14_PAREQ
MCRLPLYFIDRLLRSNRCSGLNFDRFVDRFDESTLTKVRQQYWTAKQLIRSKLGKKVCADLRISSYEVLHDFAQHVAMIGELENSKILARSLSHYRFGTGGLKLFGCELIQAEINFGRMLKEEGRTEKGDTSRAMAAVGRVQTLSAHYRGSLLWMKKTSDELDPDAENALEKFRKAQSVVRRNKERLDGLKLDTLQKVDLLAASRCNLFSQDLIEPSLDTTGKAGCEDGGDAINVER